MALEQEYRLWCDNCKRYPNDERYTKVPQYRVSLKIEDNKPVLPNGWYQARGKEYCSVACYCMPVPAGAPVYPNTTLLECGCGMKVDRYDNVATRLPLGWTVAPLRGVYYSPESLKVTCPECSKKASVGTIAVD